MKIDVASSHPEVQELYRNNALVHALFASDADPMTFVRVLGQENERLLAALVASAKREAVGSITFVGIDSVTGKTVPIPAHLKPKLGTVS